MEQQRNVVDYKSGNMPHGLESIMHALDSGLREDVRCGDYYLSFSNDKNTAVVSSYVEKESKNSDVVVSHIFSCSEPECERIAKLEVRVKYVYSWNVFLSRDGTKVTVRVYVNSYLDKVDHVFHQCGNEWLKETNELH